MSWTLKLDPRRWPLHEPFVTSRAARDTIESLLITIINADGVQGRGEGCPLGYAGESVDDLVAQIEAVRPRLECGLDRQGLLALLPAGAARAGLDGALWDLEAKRTGRTVNALAGVPPSRPIETAYTIGIRAPGEYERTAAKWAACRVLKVKVDATAPLEALQAVRRGAPDADLIVDPNQAWSVETVKALAPRLADLGVVLLEQPIPVGAEPGLDGYRCPVKLCADELINEIADLEKARGRFDVVNIKLDKAGGLTSALPLADAAVAAGFELMVGCMCGSSLSMAPGLVLAQRCAFVDLDGALIHDDWPDGLAYDNGIIRARRADFWG